MLVSRRNVTKTNAVNLEKPWKMNYSYIRANVILPAVVLSVAFKAHAPMSLSLVLRVAGPARVHEGSYPEARPGTHDARPGALPRLSLHRKKVLW